MSTPPIRSSGRMAHFACTLSSSTLTSKWSTRSQVLQGTIPYRQSTTEVLTSPTVHVSRVCGRDNISRCFFYSTQLVVHARTHALYNSILTESDDSQWAPSIGPVQLFIETTRSTVDVGGRALQLDDNAHARIECVEIDECRVTCATRRRLNEIYLDSAHVTFSRLQQQLSSTRKRAVIQLLLR